ncbi:MAG TPA: HigA family addiction module antitoxin [Acetobacteraceae bacterium]|nr:HigA family addiction module antitoxin [Acetobacteraceae bacterium]
MPRFHTHPGEVLREEFIKPLGLSANALALALHVPATRIGNILCAEKPRAVSADTAIRLGRYFGTTPEFWLNLQAACDLSVTLAARGPEITRDVHPRNVRRSTDQIASPADSACGSSAYQKAL